MERYDWDRGFARGPASGRYGREFDRGPGGSRSGRFMQGESRFRGGGDRQGRYDRGIYGSDHPGFRPYGGFHGGRSGGQDYGRGFGGGGRGWEHGGFDRSNAYGPNDRFGGWQRQGAGGWGGGGGGRRGPASRSNTWGGGGGYDRFAREPFMPEEAYQHHPEYDRPQRQIRDRWPDRASEGQGGYELVDDDEIRQAVRQNLFQDNWVDPDRIEVEVEDGIVTLTGEVDDFLEARYAWDDAWETSGVRGVVNHIHVRVDGPAGEHDTVVQGGGGTSEAKSGSGGEAG